MISSALTLIGEISATTVAVGNAITLAAVVGLAIYGWQQGLYLATLVALAALASFTVAFGYTYRFAAFLVEAELPPAQAAALAFLLLAGSLALAVRLGLGRWVPDRPVWAGSLLSRVAGLIIGGWAGFIVAGGLLVGWSLAELPPRFRLVPRDLAVDPGKAVLMAFAKTLGKTAAGRVVILDGSDVGPRSEPFSDDNRNARYDVGERYRDTDGNGAFTEMLAGTSGDAEWIPGLLDCYFLADWKAVMALQAPRLQSGATVTVEFADLQERRILYQAEARDPNRGDAITFSLAALGDDLEGSVTIDPASGSVSLSPESLDQPRETYRFGVVATDKAGLADRIDVRVTVRGIPR